ncbi:MAG: hypothetical protein J7M03_06855 [Candidatus Desulfofervidaceae bacterium]|nr:hypothetical protein [Candidatus Desulfofervidaceae bacterium]
MLKEKIKSILIRINSLTHEVSEGQFEVLKAISAELKDCYEIAKEWEEKVLIAPRKKEPLYAIYPNPTCERCGNLIVGNLIIDGTVYVCCRERNCGYLDEEYPTEYVTTSGDPIIWRTGQSLLTNFAENDDKDDKVSLKDLEREFSELRQKVKHLGM